MDNGREPNCNYDFYREMGEELEKCEFSRERANEISIAIIRDNSAGVMDEDEEKQLSKKAMEIWQRYEQQRDPDCQGRTIGRPCNKCDTITHHQVKSDGNYCLVCNTRDTFDEVLDLLSIEGTPHTIETAQQEVDSRYELNEEIARHRQKMQVIRQREREFCRQATDYLAKWVQENGEIRYESVEEARQAIATVAPFLFDLASRTKDKNEVFSFLVLLDNMACVEPIYDLNIDKKPTGMVLMHDLWFPFHSMFVAKTIDYLPNLQEQSLDANGDVMDDVFDGMCQCDESTSPDNHLYDTDVYDPDCEADPTECDCIYHVELRTSDGKRCHCCGKAGE